jgi:hypothetical protein
MDSEINNELPMLPTQESISKLIKLASYITKEGYVSDDGVEDRVEDLNPNEFDGYNGFELYYVNEKGEEKHSALPKVHLILTRTSDIGERAYEYMIGKNEGKYEIRKFETVWTDLDQEKEDELMKKFIDPNLPEKDKAEMSRQKGVEKEHLYQSKLEEARSPLGFVGEQEVGFIENLLSKFATQQIRS